MERPELSLDQRPEADAPAGDVPAEAAAGELPAVATRLPFAVPDPASGTVRPSVRGWFRLVFAVLGTLAVAAAVIAGVLLNRTDRAADRLDNRVAPARLAAAQLQAALLDQETGVRGYLLTGDPDLLRSSTQGLAAERQAAAAITGALGGDRQVRADLAAVEQAAAAWRRDFADPAIARRRAGGTGAAGDAGQPLFDQVRALLTTQGSHLDRLRAQDAGVLARTREQRDAVFLGLLVVLLLLGAGLAVLLQLSVVRPLDAIRRAATEVADGDLRRHIPDEGPADLRAVARAVEAMRARVVADLDASVEQERVLREQSEALDAQAVELRRSNADLEQFAYVASHDLQEPLRKVASFCQLLEKRYGDQLDDRARQYIDFAVDGAKRMQVLINDLLAYSRVGRMSDAQQAVATDEVVDQALHNLAVAVEESGTVLERPAALPVVRGNRTLLGMLWQNLIGNAVKFRAPGRPPVIRIEAAPDPEEPGMVRFAVEDNGIGIPQEFAEKVFVIFQRLNGRDQYEGTGIGLALCKKIVECGGGRIRLDSARTEGTRIVFTLPEEPEEQEEQEADGAHA
jgi:signal transduction histidine kinase